MEPGPAASPHARRPSVRRAAASPTRPPRQLRTRHSRLVFPRKQPERRKRMEPMQPRQPTKPKRPKRPIRAREAKRVEDDLAIDPLEVSRSARGGDPPGDNASLGWIAARSWSERPDPEAPARLRPRARTRQRSRL